ncbi:taste receptor cell protein 1 [Ictidomys tridecemlineatus]
MGEQCLPAAATLLAAFMVVSASVLPLTSAHKDSGQSPLAPGASPLQVSKRALLALDVLTKTSDNVVSLLGGELEAPGKRAEALSQGPAGGHQAPGNLSLDSSSHQLTPLGKTEVSGKATPGPASSSLTESQSESLVTEPADTMLAPGTRKITAMLQSWASPVRGTGKNFKIPGSSVTVQAPASATLGASATPRLTQDSTSSAPEPSYLTHYVTFKISSEVFSVSQWNPVALEHQLLNEHVRHELQFIYRRAFPSFQGARILEFRPGSGAVKASLVFGGWAVGPSAREVLWILYRQVKASRGMLGHLFLDESSLAASGSPLTDLALETICISFTAMKPFLPELVLPGSAPFVLLEDQILHLVTPVVSRFYKEHPQEGPLLLFSNKDQWVRVSMEYRFQNSIPTHLRGLANHLAHSIMDPILQKSSIVANGEKAELVLYEMWLQILGQPFTNALKDKTSPEAQKLRQQLTRWLTRGLRSLQNFGQVVVEEFQPEPLTAKVGAIFFGATPAQTLIQDSMHQALDILQKDEGLRVEMVTLALGTRSSGASRQPGTPSSALLILNLLLVTLILFLGQGMEGLLAQNDRAGCRLHGSAKPLFSNGVRHLVDALS